MSVPLQPVSLKKGRPPPQPRLSPRRVPADQRTSRYWKSEEDEILRRHYVADGVSACVLKLPNRTIEACYGRALKLGLTKPHTNGKGKRRTPELTPELEQQIRDAWPTLQYKSQARTLAARLGVERWWLARQIVKLGLAHPQRTKQPPWSDAENALMRKVPLHDPHACARIFKAHGFSRTPTAIVVHAKRLDLSRRYREQLTAGRAAKIVGFDAKTITRRCIDGEIRAGRRGSQRRTQQGGDMWTIEHAEFRRWILANLDFIDFRKVDKFAFVELLVGPSTDVAATMPEGGAK